MLKLACICPHPPLLIPSIGQNNLSEVNSTIEAMNELGHEISKLDVDTIVIISPHGPVQTNLMAINGSENLRGNFLQFGDNTFMEFKNNLDLGLNIKKIADQKNVHAEMINSNTPLDHGAMVPLYFLTKNNPKIKVVPVAFSYLDYQKHFEFGKIIYEATESINNEKIALVASGDLSHRLISDAPAGYSPQGKEFDKLLIKLLESNNSAEILNMDPGLIEEAGECGLRSIIILLGALSSLEYKFEKLSYEGPFGVGYLVGKFKF